MSTTFTAVCGQKCGTVAVPSLDTKNCPQCGHPLTDAPVPSAAVAAQQPVAAAAQSADAPAAATGETIGGLPVVDVVPSPPLPSAADLDAAAAEQQAAELTRAALTRAEKVLAVQAALILMGYEKAQAGELAENAMRNLEAQPSAT